MSPDVAIPESQSDAGPAGLGSALAGSAQAGTALLRQGVADEPVAHSRDMRLDRMSMQLNALVEVRRFCVEDLLALHKGAVVETIHEHSQDVPMQCGGTQLVWGEFEVVEQNLGLRITRLA